jgi:hypothetical protein
MKPPNNKSTIPKKHSLKYEITRENTYGINRLRSGIIVPIILFQSTRKCEGMQMYSVK